MKLLRNISLAFALVLSSPVVRASDCDCNQCNHECEHECDNACDNC